MKDNQTPLRQKQLREQRWAGRVLIGKDLVGVPVCRGYIELFAGGCSVFELLADKSM
jgi:hypothetical protein